MRTAILAYLVTESKKHQSELESNLKLYQATGVASYLLDAFRDSVKFETIAEIRLEQEDTPENRRIMQDRTSIRLQIETMAREACRTTTSLAA
ncbi:MAG: hypothetical protein EOP85_04070 [Verrucomicrobiaceae bacterium]|nr:MAG: hypothetical protein EOP85_04070 [Verrucomicrobiaceae bacterium]